MVLCLIDEVSNIPKKGWPVKYSSGVIGEYFDNLIMVSAKFSNLHYIGSILLIVPARPKAMIPPIEDPPIESNIS
jgi:hypothetical protein